MTHYHRGPDVELVRPTIGAYRRHEFAGWVIQRLWKDSNDHTKVEYLEPLTFDGSREWGRRRWRAERFHDSEKALAVALDVAVRTGDPSITVQPVIEKQQEPPSSLTLE